MERCAAAGFVDGFVGEQFALPSALESLRAARHADAAVQGYAPLETEFVTLSAADPLNLVGIIVPGERVAANSGKTITLRDGALECSPFIDPASAERSSATFQPLEITRIKSLPSPLGRGCPAAGVLISRSGTGEGSVAS